MFVIKPYMLKAKRFTTFFISLLLMVPIGLCANPCFASWDQAVEKSYAHARSGIQSSNHIETVVNYPQLSFSIQDEIVRAGLLFDIFSETILWEKNMHDAFPIASLTKMMVGLLVVEDIEAGKLTWKTMVQVTPEATRTGGFRVSLKVDNLLSVEDLLKAAMISSGNDAAYLLAQFLGGTEKKFVHRMNSRAASLGMGSTRFSNSTGMPAPESINDNRSSPSDLLILCREMLKHNKLMQIASMGESSIVQGKEIIKLKNHNRLVAAFDEVDGLKTGYTRNAKFCLAATAIKNRRRVIGIALGFDSQDLRNQFVGNLFSQYYEVLGMGPLQPKAGFPKAYAQGIDLSNSNVPVIHQIRKGDTLYSIAKRYGCSVEQLKGWNRLRGNTIMVGQQLKVYKNFRPLHASVAQFTGSSIIYHTVKPGDTLWNISQRYNSVPWQQLMQINGIKRANDLKIGDTIKVTRTNIK